MFTLLQNLPHIRTGGGRFKDKNRLIDWCNIIVLASFESVQDASFESGICVLFLDTGAGFHCGHLNLN